MVVRKQLKPMPFVGGCDIDDFYKDDEGYWHNREWEDEEEDEDEDE